MTASLLHDKVAAKVVAVQKESETKAQRTRASLLSAAIRIIGEKGYSNTTVDMIAHEAKVSKGVLYYHFKSKAEVATAIMDEGIESFKQGLIDASDKSETGAQALRNMAVMFATMVDENRAFAKFFTSELWRDDREWHEDLLVQKAELCDIIAQQVTHGQKEGSVRADIDSDFTATALLGMCLMLSIDWVVNHPELSKNDFCDRLLDFAMKGVVA